MNKACIVCILLGLFVTGQSRAGIFFEPYAGVGVLGEWGSSKAETSGTEMGVRLAYRFVGLYVGVDYRVMDFGLDVEGGKLDHETNRFLAIVGYEFPALLRFWVGLDLVGSGEHSSVELEKPRGSVLGFGYKVLPMLSLNLEKVGWSWTEGNDDDSFSLDGDHFLISLSVPLSF